MRDERFKQINDTYQNDMFTLLFAYYSEVGAEKGYKTCNRQEFDQAFDIWLMMSFGDISSGLNQVVNNLKKQHNYEK